MKVWRWALALTGPLLLSACANLTFTAANAGARSGDFERRADLAFGAHARQRLDAYVPTAAQSRPIIVFWYGGSWKQGRKEQYRFVGAALARAGYVAVLPDYRLYPEVRFPAFMDDAAAALAWVVQHAAELGGDARRVYLAGHSAGAHIAGLLAYDTTRLARVGVPAQTVRGFIGLSGPYALEPDSALLRSIFAAPYGFADWQPVRKVTAHSPPALLVHGRADKVVWAAHAQALAEALTAAQVPVTLRLYEGRGHADTVAAFARLAPDKLSILEEIAGFTARESPGGVTAGH